MNFDQFLDICNLDYTDYLNAIRSSLKHETVFLKRKIRDIKINAFNPEMLT